jgi:hypothetical protein
MTYTKRRVRQHIMEDQSIRIVRDLLPDEWVVREYRPDYGIDLTIELFEYHDVERTVAGTLGETLFVQVKAKQAVRGRPLRIFSRQNVERGSLEENRLKSTWVDVAALHLETSELLTVQAMGSAIPVLLLLTDLTERKVYFLCLNDMIEKVVIPAEPDYAKKKTRVLHIPLRNALLPAVPASVRAIELYAKRPKLYAAFEKFGYQHHELEHARGHYLGSASDESRADAAGRLVAMVRHFLQLILRFDLWERTHAWDLIRVSHRELLFLDAFLSRPGAEREPDQLRRFLVEQPFHRRNPAFYGALDPEDAEELFLTEISFIWSQLDNLSRVHEEMVREWFLPTYLSTVLTPDLRDARLTPGRPVSR